MKKYYGLNGVSPLGKSWKRFDIDSTGSRGYTDGENYIWIDHFVIDKNYKWSE
jgi:hypothetical protein